MQTKAHSMRSRRRTRPLDQGLVARTLRRFVPLALLGSVAFALTAASVHAQEASRVPEGYFDALTYRHIGPVGNRVSAVTGVPGDPNVFYFGAAAGGVFKTSDGGVTWDPIFDEQPAQSIGSLAIAPSDPNVVWAGTGESFIRSNVSIGNGIYRSTDAGRTWRHMGLNSAGRIGRIVIHPTDPDIVYAAVLGHLYGPQDDRGVYRSTDGGETWEHLLFSDANTGAVDIVMDPNNPRILFAAMWQMRIWTWGRESGGPGSGLFVSRDGGNTWDRLQGNGLPDGPVGKIGLAMSPDNSERVYALIETNANRENGPVDPEHGVLWRSDDGGRAWKIVNSDHTLTQRPLYYTRAVVAPDDQDELYFLATLFTKSLDGGVTFERGSPGGDHHDMWIDPLNADRMIVGHDQGVSISTNRGRTWMRPRLPIAQMYHAFTDTRVPYFVYGNRQDGSSWRGPSNSLTGGTIPIGEWRSVGGCEAGFAVPDTVTNNVVWSGCYEGILDRYEIDRGHARTVSVWPDNPEGWPAGKLRDRFQWTFPITISPHDHERVYAGSQRVHVTENGGQSWRPISPDLTTNDKSKQEKTGGLTPDDSSPTYAAVLFAIAESPLQEGLIWTGSNDGLIHVTRDGGADWENVTDRLPGLPPWGTFSNIEPSRHDAGTAYVSVDFHQVGDFRPYIYKTEDYGSSWRRISDGITASVFSYVHVVREDPRRPGLLYAGTENGIYLSFDDGDSWSSLQGNLPHAPVHWLTIQPHFNDLVVATYGRGFWILDDVTPLQEVTPTTFAEAAYLYPPRPAYRFLGKEGIQSQPADPGAGSNPTYGASIDFHVADPDGEAVEISILDSAGEEIRSLNVGDVSPGLNRIHWDLRYSASQTPMLRMLPLEHSHVEAGSGRRALGEGGRVRPLAVPGTYTVRMTTGDVVQTRELEVVQDPSSAGDAESMAAQLAFQLEIRDAVERTVTLIEDIESVREQLEQLVDRLDRMGEQETINGAIDALSGDLKALEMNLFDLRLTGGTARQDTLRWPRKLFAKLTSLAGYASGTDYGPTDQTREVLDMYQRQLSDYLGQMDALTDGALADLNRMLGEAGIPNVMRGDR